MEITKEIREQELTDLLKIIFQLPEVSRVLIKDTELHSADETEKIREGMEACYHDILSDIDLGIYVTLHPEDIANGQGYLSNPQRLGLTRDSCLGLACSVDQNGLFQMLRVIKKSGVRFDVGFFILEDANAPVYHIAMAAEEECHDEGKYWPRWDLRKADNFWFVEILALAKLYRGDYLIADHLVNLQINETLVAQMLERDNQYEVNFHRYGHREELDYLDCGMSEISFEGRDETQRMIAKKIYAAAISYDRLIKRLNPEYKERKAMFFTIWSQYEKELCKAFNT